MSLSANSGAVRPSGIPRVVNRHFLAHLHAYAAVNELQVVVDLRDEAGALALAQGATLDKEALARIEGVHLSQALESCFMGSLGIDKAGMAADEARWSAQAPLLRAIKDCGLAGGKAVDFLLELNLAPPAVALMRIAEMRFPGFRAHSVLVAVIAMSLAGALRYNEKRLVATVGIAALFHDVGELYVDPRILEPGHVFTLKDWAAYSAHPRIGAALGAEAGGFAPPVQRCIAEHHERINGFGYPGSLHGDAVSLPGRILSLAEMLAAVITRSAPIRRARIALKIVPDEFDPEMVSLIEGMLAESSETALEKLGEPDPEALSRPARTFRRIERALEVFGDLQSQAAEIEAQGADYIHSCFERFGRIQNAITSSGVLGLEAIVDCLDETELAELQFEASCVASEIAWRLSNLSREISLRSGRFTAPTQNGLQRLAQALLGD